MNHPLLNLRLGGAPIEAPIRCGTISVAIRTGSVVNAVLLLSCLAIGKHDLYIPHERRLALTIPFWVAPSSAALLLAVLYRSLSRRERAKGRVTTDFYFVAASIALLIAFGLAMAGL